MDRATSRCCKASRQRETFCMEVSRTGEGGGALFLCFFLTVSFFAFYFANSSFYLFLQFLIYFFYFFPLSRLVLSIFFLDYFLLFVSYFHRVFFNSTCYLHLSLLCYVFIISFPYISFLSSISLYLPYLFVLYLLPFHLSFPAPLPIFLFPSYSNIILIIFHNFCHFFLSFFLTFFTSPCLLFLFISSLSLYSFLLYILLSLLLVYFLLCTRFYFCINSANRNRIFIFTDVISASLINTVFFPSYYEANELFI